MEADERGIRVVACQRPQTGEGDRRVVLVETPNRGGNLGVQPVGRELERAVEGGTRRDRLSDPLQRRAVEDPLVGSAIRAAASSASSWSCGDLPVRPAGGFNVVKNEGRPGAMSE